MPPTRASYQDSNIFGNKRNDSPTVQQSARAAATRKYGQLNKSMHESKTYKSSILVYRPEDDGQHEAAVAKAQKKKDTYVDGKRMVIGGSTTRDEKNWSSNIFASDKTKKMPVKKLLGKNDQGKGALYGDEKVSYERK